LTFNQLVAGSNPARPTISDKTISAERRFFVFVLRIKFVWDENLPQVRVERRDLSPLHPP
ncbi:MAG: hypothetical protein RR680_20320, partial [Hafnia sp.]